MLKRFVSSCVLCVLLPAPLWAADVEQAAYLKASNTQAFDLFGAAVAASHDTVVVSAYSEDGGSPGVDGDQADESVDGAGAVYVFAREGAGWAQQAYLKASNPGGLDQFGRDGLALDGDTLVVGAQHEDSAATGVDGDQADESADSAGAAYVFARDGAAWSQQAYLKASDTAAGDRFGYALAVSGDTLVVGAPQFQAGPGAVHVYVRDGATWSWQARLEAPAGDFDDRFGRAVALDGDTLVVGASGEDSAATGVDGDPLDDSAADAGAAYVFVRDGASWNLQAYLKASHAEAGDAFGFAISLQGDTLVVSAPTEDGGSTGVGGDPADNGAFGAGAAYVFTRAGGTWSQQAYLKASNTDSNDRFGMSVALSGERLAVGAHWEDSDAAGIDGDQAHDGLGNAGAVYLFARDAGSWSQLAYVKASNPDAQDEFGERLALSGRRLVIGARGEDDAATGVGDPSGVLAQSAGAAYLFDLELAWTDEGCGLAGEAGEPLLVGSGDLSPGSAAAVDLSNAAPSALAALFVAPVSEPLVLKGGTLKAFPHLPPFFVTTSAAGAVAVPFTVPANVPSGAEVWVQWAVVDAGAAQGVAFSNALLGVAP